MSDEEQPESGDEEQPAPGDEEQPAPGDEEQPAPGDEEQDESGDEEQDESGDEEQDEFEIPPDPRVLKALTENPLQWIQALCELIDNSIDSFWAARAAGRAVDDPRIEVFIPGAA